jgi:hypothetical protein
MRVSVTCMMDARGTLLMATERQTQQKASVRTCLRAWHDAVVGGPKAESGARVESASPTNSKLCVAVCIEQSGRHLQSID